MKRYQIWNGTDSIITPSGAQFTAQEWGDKFPWVRAPGARMIITTPPINGGGAGNFFALLDLRRRRGGGGTDGGAGPESLGAPLGWGGNPPVSNEPTVEERTAAALEFLAMNSLPDQV